MTEYSFVLDKEGKRLSPTNTKKAWYLIRKKKAILVCKYPMVIKLNRVVTDIDESGFICGIDDGSVHVGIAIVQKCKTRNKVILKGTIEQRQDVKHLMTVRKGYRKYRRSNKRYRPARYNNRSASNREERITPSIKQKRQATLRVINRLNKYINITKYHLEDVAIDIRALTDGYKPYGTQYQKSNRLDENIRKAVILRDGCKCVDCGKTNCQLEVHHITPKRDKGSNNLGNLVTLCIPCHNKTKGQEDLFKDNYYNIIKGKNLRLDYAQHVMQGKTYLRKELSKLGELTLTTGGETANKRIAWNIDKSHSNDAVVITDLFVRNSDCGIKDWIIKPMRRKSKAVTKEVNNFKHRDLVKYTKRNGDSYVGYVTAIYPETKQCNITTKEGQVLKRYGLKSCEIMWRFNKIYWF